LPLRYEKDGDIAVFTIENGSVNPTNPMIHKELFLALKDFLADTSIRCGHPDRGGASAASAPATTSRPAYKRGDHVARRARRPSLAA
jgi:hypothetical protein